MKFIAAIFLALALPLSASAQEPSDLFFDPNPQPKKNELSFDTGGSETDRYCVCLHKECWKYKETEYITCTCLWMSCVDLDMKPY